MFLEYLSGLLTQPNHPFKYAALNTTLSHYTKTIVYYKSSIRSKAVGMLCCNSMLNFSGESGLPDKN